MLTGSPAAVAIARCGRRPQVTSSDPAFTHASSARSSKAYMATVPGNLPRLRSSRDFKHGRRTATCVTAATRRKKGRGRDPFELCAGLFARRAASSACCFGFEQLLPRRSALRRARTPAGEVLAARLALRLVLRARDIEGDRHLDLRMERDPHCVEADRLDRRVEPDLVRSTGTRRATRSRRCRASRPSRRAGRFRPPGGGSRSSCR